MTIFEIFACPVNLNIVNFKMDFENQWQFLQFGWHLFSKEQPQPPLVSPRPPEQRKSKETFDKNLFG